jgi:peptide/nickel transport system substrate-binding protein
VLLAQLVKLSIVPHASVEKLGNDGFNQHPVGSGPYRLTNFTRGVKVELAANPSYWRGAPPFARVEMRPVPNEETRIADVRTARADIVRVSLTDTADSLKGDAQVKVLFAPVERAAMLMLNALTGPSKDVRVRRAIAHAIDRNLIVEALLKGYARVVDEPMTPANFGWVDGLKSYDYDPAAAKSLLKEAGVVPGTKVTFPTGPFFDQRVVQAIQQMLADVGLDAQISMTDGPTYLRLRQGRPDEAGDVSFFRCPAAAGMPMALFPLFHSSSQWAKYSNPGGCRVGRGAQPTRSRQASGPLSPSTGDAAHGHASSAALPGRDDVCRPQGSEVPADTERGLLPYGHGLEPVSAKASQRRSAMRSIALALLMAVTATAALAQPKDALTVDLPGDVATMDPHLQWDTESYTVYRNIFDNLVTRDVAGKIVPQVATAWRYADDTTIVFDLHTDIAFHDGNRLTPEDVVFSVRRVINPAFKSPQLSQFDQITSADVTEPAQVTLHTKTPYPVLMAQLVKLSIVPKAYVDKVGDPKFNQEPRGSGPYRLRTWQRGVQSVLDSVDNYWRGKPPFRTVTFRAVPDGPTRIADLRTGRADITRGLSPDDAESLKSDKSLQLLPVATERVAYLFINTLATPTKDKRVRQAIAMAIDRDTIISALQQGYARPVNIVLTPANFGYVADVPGWRICPRARLIKEVAPRVRKSFTTPLLRLPMNEAVENAGDVGLKVEIR